MFFDEEEVKLRTQLVQWWQQSYKKGVKKDQYQTKTVFYIFHLLASGLFGSTSPSATTTWPEPENLPLRDASIKVNF